MTVTDTDLGHFGELVERVAPLKTAKPLPHTKDEDCTLGPDDCCTMCGVYHGEPCPQCDGRGFHREGCLAAEW